MSTPDLQHRDGTSASSKKSKQTDLASYKKEKTTVAYPDGKKQDYDYEHLEETYNDLKNERTQLSAELGELIKPVNERKEKLDAFVSEHMVSLTPTQMAGLQTRPKPGRRRFCRSMCRRPTSSTAANPVTWGFASRSR